MNTDPMKSLLIKLVVVGLTSLATYLHVGVPDSINLAIATDIVDAAVLLYGAYRSWGMKLIPHRAVGIIPVETDGTRAGEIMKGDVVTGKVVSALLAAILLSLLVDTGRAADIPPAPVKAPALTAASCTPTSCSSWYAGVGLTGNGTNADILGSGLSRSVFAAGGILDVHGGYQLWNGSYLFAAEVGIGNQFQNGPLSQFGSKTLIGYEGVKLGGALSGLFGGTSTTVPGQASSSLTVPQSIASAFLAPYLWIGAVQRAGVNEWTTGGGMEFVLASNWNLDIRYMYAPGQSGLDPLNMVTVGVNYHFGAK